MDLAAILMNAGCGENGSRRESPCRDDTGRWEHVEEVVKEGSQNYKGDWGWLMELGRDLLGEGGEGVISMVNGNQILVVLPGFLQVYAPT